GGGGHRGGEGGGGGGDQGGGRGGRRTLSRGGSAGLRAVLHYETPGNGHGARDQPVDRRGTRRTDTRDPERDARNYFLGEAADGRRRASRSAGRIGLRPPRGPRARPA